MEDIQKKLESLKKSKFRSQFHLKEQEKLYIQEKGIDTIERHARDFIEKRLAPKNIQNDGHQTPWKGHPVFIAEHATATCCRGCLEKWHHISKNHALTEYEKQYVLNLIMSWISNEMKGEQG